VHMLSYSSRYYSNILEIQSFIFWCSRERKKIMTDHHPSPFKER
jgi:hypothetical protein